MMFSNLKIVLLMVLCFNTLIVFGQNSRVRKVLLFADTENNTILTQQMKILQSDEAGCAERDIVIETFVLDKTDKKLLAKYNISPVPFTFLLIGKDGHVALRSYKTISKAQLFALIDGMPMRKDEMKRKRT